MAEKRIILELGAGADLHGRDYTKAAKRAVEDAMRHSSLSIFRSLDLQAATMRVEITIGYQVTPIALCRQVASVPGVDADDMFDRGRLRQAKCLQIGDFFRVVGQ